MAGYSRQSSSGIVDGGVISAEDLNSEFNQLATAFANGGHSHSGSAAEGPQITNTGLASGSVIEAKILDGAVTTNKVNNLAITAAKLAADAVTTAKILNSNVTTAKIADDAITGAKIDSTTTVTAASFVGPLTGNSSTATALATARNIAGQSFDGSANISIATTDLTDVTATSAEVNILDGDTTALAITLADADRVVVNDAGTMKQVALTDFETYFEGALDTLTNVTSVGALDAGSITSGFGAIDNGSSNITTTGTVSYGTLSDGTTSLTATAAELNYVDGVSSNIQTQLGTKAPLDGATLINVDVNSGSIDGVTIGTASVVTDLRVDNIKIDGNEISSTNTNGDISLTPAGTGEVNISKVDIDSGAIDGVTIGTASVVTDLRVDTLKLDGSTISSTDNGASVTIDTSAGDGSLGGYIFLTPANAGKTIIKNPQFSTGTGYTGSNGALLFSANSGGIDFARTAVSTVTGTTTTSGILMDYAEGTWTPRLEDTGGSQATVGSFGAANTTFTKIGRMVNIQCSILNINSTGRTGTIFVDQLPYTPLSNALLSGSCLVSPAGSTRNLVAYESSGRIFFYDVADASIWSFSDIADDATDLNFNLWYKV